MNRIGRKTAYLKELEEQVMKFYILTSRFLSSLFGVFCVFRLLFSRCRNGFASMTCVGTLVVKLQ